MKRNLRNALVFLAAAEALTGCGTTQPISNQPPQITQNYVGLSNPPVYPVTPPNDPYNRFQNSQGQPSYQQAPSLSMQPAPNYTPPQNYGSSQPQSFSFEVDGQPARIMIDGQTCTFTLAPAAHGLSLVAIDMPGNTAELYIDGNTPINGVPVVVSNGRCVSPQPLPREINDMALNFFHTAYQACQSYAYNMPSVTWEGPVCTIERQPGPNGGRNLVILDTESGNTGFVIEGNPYGHGRPAILRADGSWDVPLMNQDPRTRVIAEKEKAIAQELCHAARPHTGTAAPIPQYGH